MTMHAIRWAWYLLRLALYSSVALLRFIGRPSSRILFVCLILAAAFLLRDKLHGQITTQLRQADPGYRPEGLLLDVILAASAVAACIAFVLVSRVLKVTLGAFSVGMRPLPPLRKLKPTSKEITAAVVRIVVPPLPKRAA